MNRYFKNIFMIIVSMRPKQWTKNLILFAALIFSKNLFEINMVLLNIFAFIVFCFLTGSVYLLNDIIDVNKDKQHPAKSGRPIASGNLSVTTAKIAVLFIVLCALSCSFFISNLFAITIIAYLILQVSYSLFLKNVVIIDVFCIAAGFFLRVIAGANAITVPVSHWLLVCTFFISLFIALTKRRHEMILLQDGAIPHRQVLQEYNTILLDQMISVVTASTVVSYTVYTLSIETIEKFGTDKLIYTIPFVLYGIYRYLYLTYHKEEGGRPEIVFLTDKPMIFSILLYGLVTVIILYFKKG